MTEIISKGSANYIGHPTTWGAGQDLTTDTTYQYEYCKGVTGLYFYRIHTGLPYPRNILHCKPVVFDRDFRK